MAEKPVKARLIISGTVQGVGFRARVFQLASEEGVQGLVRNRRDGTVEVYCETGSQEQLGKFVQRLRHPFHAWPLPEGEPERVELFPEGHEDFAPAWKKFQGFEIDSQIA